MIRKEFINAIDLDRLKAVLPKVVLYITTTGSLLIGQAAQLLGFIILARYLGAEQFGKLMLITAMTSIALSISGLGTEEIMVRRCIQEPTLYRKLLGHSLILILISGLLLTLITLVGLYTLVTVTANPLVNTATLITFAFSNIVLAEWIILAEFIFIAHKQFMYANYVVAGFAITRALAAVVACLVFGVDRLETWVFWHAGIHIVGSIACMAALWGYGAPRWCLLPEEIWRGIHVATMHVITELRQNIDRIVLATAVTAATVGAYSVASNIVRYSLVGLITFSRLFYPTLVIAGLNGVSAALKLSVKYLPVIVGLGIVISVGLFIVAPFLPRLFGEEYRVSTHYLMILCWLPILVAVQNIAYDALGAAERHGIRSLFYNFTGVVGVALIASLTYAYGVNGAFVGLYVVQAMLSLSVWLLLLALGKRAENESD